SSARSSLCYRPLQRRRSGRPRARRQAELLAAPNGSRVLVVPFVVNNNRKQGIGTGGHFAQPQVGCYACPGRSATRSGALQTRDRSSLWRSRISDAPLRSRSRCIASGTHESPRTRAYPIHLSNSPSRSRAACLRPGFATLLRQPESRVGGAPRDVRVL